MLTKPTLAVTIATHHQQHMTTTIKKPINYLNNRDILKEIHASKTTYCVFAKPEYHQYDYIIDHGDRPLLECMPLLWREEVLLAARTTRAARLSEATGTTVSPNEVPITDLIFRVMTWDHIPLAPKKSRKAAAKKRTAEEILEVEENETDDLFTELEEDAVGLEINDAVHVKVNFVPFQHFKIDENNSAYCVGKSHWRGDLVEGEFSKEHGKITNKLAKMYMLLADKYAQKWNWRGYTYNDEMRACAILQLTYVGLRFNEARSENPFAYYTQAITNSFKRVLNTEKRVRDIRDDLLELNNLNPSYTRMNSGESYSDD